MTLTIPPIAPLPYSAQCMPFITSTFPAEKGTKAASVSVSLILNPAQRIFVYLDAAP